MIAIVDTNVPLAASGRSSMSPACARRCVVWIQYFVAHGRIAIDDGWRILKEYLRHRRADGQKDVHSEFVTWVLRNQANPQRCELVHVTEHPPNSNTFAEFPDDPQLAGFDRSDRVFVAVAGAVTPSPPIVVAADTDWLNAEDSLAKHGVTITCLCRSELAGIQKKKKASNSRTGS